MQMIIQFPFESRQRTAFNNFLIQHIPLVKNAITKIVLSNVSFLLISTNNLSSLTEISWKNVGVYVVISSKYLKYLNQIPLNLLTMHEEDR